MNPSVYDGSDQLLEITKQQKKFNVYIDDKVSKIDFLLRCGAVISIFSFIKIYIELIGTKYSIMS